MRALIGDNPVNQRFLRVALGSRFDDIVVVSTADKLIDEAARGADLIIFDPRIEQSDLRPVDIGPELLRMVGPTRLVVVTPSDAHLEWAERNGIISARKHGFLHIEGIEAAIQRALEVLDAEAAPSDWYIDLPNSPTTEPPKDPVETAKFCGVVPAATGTYDWDALIRMTHSVAS